MPDSPTVSFARLLDWLEGHLTVEEASAVAEQVARADATTQQDVAWLQAFRALSASMVLVAPPPETHALLKDSFAEYARSRQTGSVQRLVATLVFDSSVQSAMPGVRSAAASAPQRQLIYATQAADIALNFQPHHYNQDLDVSGQIFPKGQFTAGGFSVQLLRGLKTIGRDGTDELGEFMFADIPPGVYVLSLRADQLDLLVAPIEVYA